jgi:hypothetical protein
MRPEMRPKVRTVSSNRRISRSFGGLHPFYEVNPALVLGATLLFLGACATTTFTSTWKAPDEQTINPAGKTIAAVFVSGDERNRHAAEDALAKDLNVHGAHGVPGYKLLPNEIRGDAEDMLARLKEAGANEVVVMRVVGEDKWPSFLQVHGSTFNASDAPGTRYSSAPRPCAG